MKLKGGNMKSVKIKTTGMHCAGCEGMVKETVSELEGVKSVKASFKNEVVDVEYDEAKAAVEAIKAKIVEAGYKPE
jgi:copper chaperone CopZ